MKEKNDILSDLGKIIIREVYDDGLKFFKELKNNQTKWNIGKEYSDVINKLTENDQEILFKYVEQTIRTTLFGFLGIFEENEEFKLIYEENGIQKNLVEISEMLKAELIIENGWIDKFSKEK